MTKVTQDDREAAAKVAVLVEMRELILAGKADYHAEPWAAHRITADLAGYERGQRETAERIVAWLWKCQKAKLNHHAEVCHREDDDVLDAIVTAMNTFAYAADAIEAGEWK